MSLEQVVRQISNHSPPHAMPVRVTAIDGSGGSGKSTLADRIAAGLGDAPIVHTDDFASWEEPLDWWPRVIEEVFRPLADAKPARYRRYDWTRRQLCDWIDIPSCSDVVIEGVGASRLAFGPI